MSDSPRTNDAFTHLDIIAVFTEIVRNNNRMRETLEYCKEMASWHYDPDADESEICDSTSVKFISRSPCSSKSFQPQ